MDTVFDSKEAAVVSAGIQWLDDTDPDWAQKVDLEQFSFWMCDRCVLGQVFAAFDPDAAGYTFILDLFGLEWIKAHGFCVTNTDNLNAEEVLNRWVNTIEARQALVNA